MSLIFIIFIFISFIFNQDDDSLVQLNKDLISNYYESKKEFILILKNGEKYKVSEILQIDEKEEKCKLNILNNKLSRPLFYKKNISRLSDYELGDYEKFNRDASMAMEIKIEDILSIQAINYDAQIREIKIYSFIILGIYLVFSAF